MRVRWLALVAVVTIPLVLLPQSLPRSSFVVRLQYAKIDLPRSSSSSCLAIFPDGRFHMEQSSDWPASAPRIFEDSLSGDSLRSLSSILDARELRELRVVEPGLAKVAQGEVIWAIVPRQEGDQILAFTALEGSGAQVAKPFPASLRPLVQWVQVTTKALTQQKLRPLKKSKQVNCWLTKH